MANMEEKNQGVVTGDAGAVAPSNGDNKKGKKWRKKKFVIHREVVKKLAQETRALHFTSTALFDLCAVKTATLLAAAADNLGSAEGESLISRRAAAEMLDELRSLRLKPEKGRGKDISRIVEFAKRIDKRIKTPKT